MKNTIVNREAIKRVADALGDMNEDVVYVGGATVSLYADDPAAEDVRPTKDLDISLSLATSVELERAREELHRRGFIQSALDSVICRFRLGEILVDFMNTKAIDWAPANPWFGPGYDKRERINIDGTSIFILPLPYFLASKFSAFENRGLNDPRTSHDLEDIIYIIDYRTDIQDQLRASPENVKNYLQNKLASLLDDPAMKEAIEGNLDYETRELRLNRLIEIITSFISE